MKATAKLILFAGTCALVVSLFAAVAMAQGMTTSGQMGQIPGLQNNPLTPQQQREVAQIRNYTRMEVQQIRQSPSMSAQEKSDRIQQAKMQEHSEILNVLNEPQQAEFTGWWAQRQAVGGVTAGPGMQTQMASGNIPGLQQNPLTSDQKQQVSQIRQRTQIEVRSIRQNRSLSPSEKSDRIQQARQQSHQEILNVLTPEQQTEFDSWWKSRTAPVGGVTAAPAPQPVAPETPAAPEAPAETPEMTPAAPEAAGPVVLQQNPLTDQQRQQLEDVRTSFRGQVQQIQSDMSLSQDQKMTQINQAWMNAHNQIMGILTPEQRQELVNWWIQNPNAVLALAGETPLQQNPLTNSQLDKINDIRSNLRNQVQKVQSNASLTPDQQMAQIDQAWVKAHNQIAGVLTPAQKQEFINWWLSQPQVELGPAM